MSKSEQSSKINEKTMVSLNIGIALISLAVWLVRLNDRVEAHDKELAKNANFDKRLYKIENKLNIDDGDDE